MTKISHDSEIPANGQQVITACAFIHQIVDREEKVFLPKRADTKKFLPGVYELPGGHIDFGEDVVVGLKREINEEFGMDIEVGDPFFAFTYSNEIKGSHSIEVIYFAKFVTDTNKISLNAEDHSTFGWFGVNELSKTYTSTKGADDIEQIAIRKAFKLMQGNSPEF
jgi:8-oxo-dGTP diphosphatase